MHDGQVAPGCAPFRELLGQMISGRNGSGDHNESRGVSVEAVNNAWARSVRWCRGLGGQGPIAMNERVDQGSAVMTGRRMDHHPGWFVNDDQVFVFIHNGQRNVFGYRRGRGWRWNGQRDYVAGLKTVTDFGWRLIIDRHITRTDPVTDLGPRQLRTFGKVAV